MATNPQMNPQRNNGSTSNQNGSRPAPHEEDPWMTASEAGRVLGVATSTVCEYVLMKMLPGIRMGGLIKIRTSAINKALEIGIGGRPARRSQASK